MGDSIILEMKGITKVFPGTKALDNVFFELKAGEVHALIGENGAGKSTLMKILLGIYRMTEGEIYLRGRKVTFRDPKDALSQGISMIHQEISLVSTLDVAQNIWLGQEKKFIRNGLLSNTLMYRKTEELLSEYGLKLNVKSKVADLSIAQMQMVEIMRAISYNSDIIIMDEPTSALTETEIQILYGMIRNLSAQGISTIFISHKLEEIFEICDRVTVLRDGKYIGTDNSDTITQKQLVEKIVGRQLDNMFPKSEVEIGDTVLEVENLTKYGTFRNVSFTLRRGEILGFCGLMGAGRTEIMRSLFGIDQCDSGRIVIENREVRIRSPKKAIEYGLAMVTEDRLRAGVISTLSIKANMTLAYFRSICNKLSFFSTKKEAQDFTGMAEKMQVKYASPNQLISSLSGGNQQKVIIGRWLLTQPKILILDEPTRGIDVGSKSEIHRIIGKLVEQGVSILLVSSEMPELLGVSDRILVIRKGEIVYECLAKDTEQETLITYAFGAANANQSE